MYGTSAGTTGVTIQYIDGSTTDANTGAWRRLPHRNEYAVTVQAVKDGTPGNWSAVFDTYPAFPIYMMRNWHPGFGLAEQYQSLDASVRTSTGFTLGWTHPYRTAGFVAECVELVNGQASGSWTTCKKDDNVFSEKTVNGNPVTTRQAHLYGTTANDRVITGIAIDDLDIDTTGTQALSPVKSYDVRVRTLNPSGQSGFTYPPWSILAPYSNSDLVVTNVTSSGATLTIHDHTGNWWYEGRPITTTTYGLCTEVTTAATTLTTLSSATQHDYRAYSASGCADANLIAIAGFKTTLSGQTVSLAMTNLTWNTAKATLSGHTGSWWYKFGERARGAGSCTAGPPAFILNLSGLPGGTAHTLNAYSDSTCATQIASADFQTPPGPLLTASSIAATTATLTLSDWGSDWWHQGTERGATQTSCVKASGTTVDLTNLTAGKPYTWGAFSASTCAADTLLDSVSFTTLALNVSNIGATTATLTIVGHSEAWHYKANTAPHTACQSAVTAGTRTKDLTGLTPGTSYTYEAYSDSTCTTANKLATAAAFTTHSSVSNMAETLNAAAIGVYTSQNAAMGFTTGASANGYTLRSVTIKVGVTSALSTDTFTAAVHAESGGNPAASPTHTLSGSTPTAAGDHTYTCSGGCALAANTTYYLVLTGNNTLQRLVNWSTTDSANQTNAPSGFGWSIADGGKYTSSGNWTATTDVGVFQVAATPDPILTSSGVTSTGATLTIANHVGDWYYDADTGPHTTCQGPVSGNSVTLSGLTAGTTYTYTAYSDSACTTANELATAAAFAHPTLAASNVAATSATLTIAGHSGDWYAKETAPSTNATCSSAISGTTHALSTLTAGTAYTFKAYSDSACTTELATATFTTLASLTASSVTATGATLTIAGHAGDWYAKETAPSTNATCSSAISGTTHTLTTLSAGTAYTFKAYSDSGCTTELATATFTTLASLTASNIGATTATLTITGHSGQWWYKGNVGPDATCQGPVSAGDSTKDLTGLSRTPATTTRPTARAGAAAAICWLPPRGSPRWPL